MSTKSMNKLRKWIQVLELFVSVSAVIGGALLVARPDGSLLKLDVGLSEGTFASWLIPGVLLIGLGFVHAGAALLMQRKNRYDTTLSAFAGAVLVIWIAAQVVFIGFTGPLLQVFMVAIGFMIYTLAMELVHEGQGPGWLPKDH
jgi:hypothetical protein